MKIRSDFVTNSSSSSYVSIHFRCKKLREILNEHQEDFYVVEEGIKNAHSEDEFDFSEDFDDVADAYAPSTQNNIIVCLRDFIRNRYNRVEWERSAEFSLIKLENELSIHKKEILATINHVHWNFEYSTSEDEDTGGVHEFDEEYTLEDGKENYHSIERVDDEIIDETSSEKEYNVDEDHNHTLEDAKTPLKEEESIIEVTGSKNRLEFDLSNTEMPDRIERIEHVHVGDEVQLILDDKELKRQIIVSSDEGPLGSIDSLYFYKQVEGDKYKRVGKISSVTPLSKRPPQCKRPLIRVILYPKRWDMSKSIDEDLEFSNMVITRIIG